VNLLTLAGSDAGLSPTFWQRSTYPVEFQPRIHVVHDGVDTTRVRPDPTAAYTLANGLRFQAGDEVVTIVNRNLEPYRGFHVFMRALPEILARRPQAHVVIVGADGAGYGKTRADGLSYREALLAEVGGRIDRSRVHFIGRVPYDDLIALFKVSMAHIYLTYPFVLSWSMIEAMAAGALIIGSATPPVQEVIQSGDNGILVDFFDVAGLAETIIKALENPRATTDLRRRARQTAVERYDLETVCLPNQIALIQALLEKPPI
jgi:glycosyltransferase involved in cell wall biosynthesis